MENRVFFSFSDNAVEKRSTKVHGPQNFEKHFSPHPHLRFLPYLRFCRARIFRRKAAIAWHQKRFFFSMLSLSTAILRAGCVASSGVSFIFDSFLNSCASSVSQLSCSLAFGQLISLTLLIGVFQNSSVDDRMRLLRKCLVHVCAKAALETPGDDNLVP